MNLTLTNFKNVIIRWPGQSRHVVISH